MYLGGGIGQNGRPFEGGVAKVDKLGQWEEGVKKCQFWVDVLSGWFHTVVMGSYFLHAFLPYGHHFHC